MSTLKHWLWLATRGQMPGLYASRLLETFGSPEAAYFSGDDDGPEHLPEHWKAALRDKSMDRVEKVLADCDRLGLQILTIQDTTYPDRLRQLPDAPCVLYVKGCLPQMDEEAAVGMVGARRATPYGMMTAGRLALDLARQGAVIVSGSARGIDAAALNGALKGGGRVVSVLGNGIDVIYPREHESLYDDVAAEGALVTEYPPGTPPNGSHFPVRNRIIAGLSLGIVVVEGNEKSGSLITARWALEQNRDVFAVPGNLDAVMSRGPNSLIRRGEAKLIQDAWDILEDYAYLYPAKIHPRTPLSQKTERARLGTPPHSPPSPAEEPAGEPEDRVVVDLAQQPEALTDDEVALLRGLQGRLLTADDLVEASGLPARRVLSALTMLQVRQLVKEEPGKRFCTPVLLKE